MKRPVLTITLTALGLLLVLGALAGFWAYHRFLYTKPLTPTELSDIAPDWDAMAHPAGSPWITGPDGTPDWNPIAAYNARIDAMDDAHRAWPLVIEIRHAYPELFDQREPFSEDPNDEDWGATRELLEYERSREATDRLLDAALRPVLGRRLFEPTQTIAADSGWHITTFDPDERDALVRLGHTNHTLSPPSSTNLTFFEAGADHVQHDLRVARVLVGSANLALLEGDPDRYTDLIEGTETWGRHCDEFPLAIDQNIRMICVVLCGRSVAWALETHPDELTDAHLLRLDTTLAQLGQYQTEWRADTLTLHDMVRRSLDANDELSLLRLADTATIPSPPSSTPDTQLGPLAQRMLYASTEINAMPAMSRGERTTTTAAQEWLTTQSGTIHHGAYMFLLGYSAITEYAERRLEDNIEKLRPVRDAIAMQRQARRHGQMPKSIEEVDPDLRPD